MTNLEVDVVVVGAGLVGLSAAIAFAHSGKKVALVGTSQAEAKITTAWDARIYALTPATENWLESLGVWQHVNTARICDIHAMHLWSEGAERPLVLADEDAHLKKLGVIAENQNIMHALHAIINATSGVVLKEASCKNIENMAQHICLTLDDDTQLSASLLVAADGAHSFVRQQMRIATHDKNFHQTAIVANFLTGKNHRHIASQWFGLHETLALLPMPDKHVSMVWSMSTERSLELLLKPQELAERVQARTCNALGTLKQVGDAMAFPLNQTTATQLIARRVVLIGDAAHRVHPMAGQGVNLGFRDVIEVQNLLTKSHAMHDIGEQSFLRQYERARKADILSINGLTSGLDTLFATEQTVLKRLTNFGMQQLNKNSEIKKILIKQAVA